MSTKLLLICLLIMNLWSLEASARNFKRITIPDAYCGNGSPYAVWVDHKDKEQLLIEFMGGGACWSANTCFGPKLRTWIFPIPAVPVISWLSNDLGPEVAHGPLASASMIYFPYCTGDVHAGQHVAKYQHLSVQHSGYSNVIKSLAYLQEQGIVSFQQYKEVVLSGSSAGAIGALTHAKSVQPLLNPSARKVLLLDAPGMHFGEGFWDKFSLELIRDFQTNFGKLGIKFTTHDHNMAPFLPQVGQSLATWRVGILQGARDIIMSALFGNISPRQHRAQVYGQRGIYDMSMLTNNISVWVPDTFQHTFLLTQATAMIRANQLNAAEFVDEMLQGNDSWHERTW